EALGHYVDALISGWNDSSARVNQTVVWSVDLGEDDITRLMRDAIAAEVHQVLAKDDDLGPNVLFLDGTRSCADADSLAGALAETRPMLVVTTSHGMTGPLANREAMRANLGLPVDQSGTPLLVNRFLDQWDPDGAIWYAHACCSAGGDSETSF